MTIGEDGEGVVDGSAGTSVMGMITSGPEPSDVVAGTGSTAEF